MSVDVAVRSSNISESVLALRLGAWTSGIAIGVLSELILSMELGGGETNWGSVVNEPSRGHGQDGGENDLP